VEKGKKNIDQTINESFNNQESDFNDYSWSEVKNKLDSRQTVDKVIFNALKPQSDQLPDAAWQEMNDALDIETVWKRLEKRPRRRPFIFWWRAAGILILIGLLTLPFSMLFDNNSKDNPSRKQSKIELTDLDQTSLNLIDSDFKSSEIASSNSKEDTVISYSIQNLSSKDSYMESNPLNKDLEQSINVQPQQSVKHKELWLVDKLDIKKISSIDYPIENPSVIKIDSNYIKNVEDSRKKFTVGFISSISNTWISDADSRLGMKKNSLIFNDIVFSPATGVYFEYRAGDKFGLLTEVFINSIVKSRLNLYQNGNLKKKETQLEYFTTSVLASTYFPIKKSSLSLSGGVYMSLLKRSSIKIDDVITDINSNYAPIDFGFKADLSHFFNVNRFKFSYGINASYGVSNIFLSTENLPNSLNETHNILLGLNIKLGYQF
jgi:hypothetical protein